MWDRDVRANKKLQKQLVKTNLHAPTINAMLRKIKNTLYSEEVFLTYVQYALNNDN